MKRNKGSAPTRGEGAGNEKPPASPQEAWHQAIAAYEQGQYARAQALLVPLLNMPSVPGEVSLLAGLVEAMLDDPERAEVHLHRAVQLVPSRREGWLGLGNAQHMQGNYEAAIRTYRGMLRSDPADPAALYNLAMTCIEYDRDRVALDTLDQLLAVEPEWADAARSRASVLARLGRMDQARTAYEALLERDPDNALLRLEFAGFLEQCNCPDEAAQWVPSAAEIGDNHRAEAQAEGLRAQFLARAGDHEAALARVRAARERTGADFLGYREGTYLDRLGRPDEAMAAFAAGNAALLEYPITKRLLRRGYADLVQAKVENGMPRMAELIEEPPERKRRPPVFLVGLPRSGTTLLDRILGAHPETEVLQEFGSLGVIGAALNDGCSPGEARQAYWDYVDRHIEVDSSSLVIDKNPLHVPDLDKLPEVFPEAQVVVTLRHPYDAALSCYMQHFELNTATVHFLNLESTAQLCARLLRLLLMFSEARPEQTVRIRYEDIVEDFHREVPRVLRAIGLGWHDDVAAYAERSSGLVTTPSYEQVMRGLYRSSIGRWQRYQRWIQPFREHVGPLLESFGYDEGEA